MFSWLQEILAQAPMATRRELNMTRPVFGPDELCPDKKTLKNNFPPPPQVYIPGCTNFVQCVMDDSDLCLCLPRVCIIQPNTTVLHVSKHSLVQKFLNESQPFILVCMLLWNCKALRSRPSWNQRHLLLLCAVRYAGTSRPVYWQPTNLWFSRSVWHAGTLLPHRLCRAELRRSLSQAGSATRWSCNWPYKDAMGGKKARAAVEHDIHNRSDICFITGKARHCFFKPVPCKPGSCNTREGQTEPYRVSNTISFLLWAFVSALSQLCSILLAEMVRLALI